MELKLYEKYFPTDKENLQVETAKSIWFFSGSQFVKIAKDSFDINDEKSFSQAVLTGQWSPYRYLMWYPQWTEPIGTVVPGVVLMKIIVSEQPFTQRITTPVLSHLIYDKVGV